MYKSTDHLHLKYCIWVSNYVKIHEMVKVQEHATKIMRSREQLLFGPDPFSDNRWQTEGQHDRGSPKSCEPQKECIRAQCSFHLPEQEPGTVKWSMLTPGSKQKKVRLNELWTHGIFTKKCCICKMHTLVQVKMNSFENNSMKRYKTENGIGFRKSTWLKPAGGQHTAWSLPWFYFCWSTCHQLLTKTGCWIKSIVWTRMVILTF